MKITHLCLNAPVTDGWTYQDNLLPKYHKELGYDVSVITSKYTRVDSAELMLDDRDVYYNEYDIKTIRIDNKYNTTITSKFKIYKNLYSTLSKEQPDILFIHGVQFLDIFKVIKYLKKNQKVTTYVDNHADYSNSASNWFSKNILHGTIWRRCAKSIEPYVTKFYGVLPARVDFLNEVYKIPKEQIELLLMGVDDERALESKNRNVGKEIRKKFNISDSDFLIVTGGKIDNKKNILLLMKAIKKNKDENLKLLIFGSVADNLKEQFDSLINDNNIIYAGWINGDETYNYFAIADLVIFPGRHSVFWEQVAGLGIPLVVKYWDGTTHIDVGGNCEFLYKDSVEEIQEKINNIINQPEKYSLMKTIAETKAKEKFSYREIARQSIN